ncbi:DUF1330 domain-containing protein [Nakamurella lactea]|uniref:DUF1330 domain-containing protein n=1 Tax=Nakamurella lactea TaxID=459515 RepID=UPI0004091526|nr:DUF1330 domain-containing protein [Nakamurella lactea]
MTKGYWIGRVSVSDPQEYRKYLAANGPVFAAYGGRFLVRGGQFESVEGEARDRNVVLEFPSYQAALDCYHSAEYQAVLPFRTRASVAEMLVIEGYDGPQPAGD